MHEQAEECRDYYNGQIASLEDKCEEQLEDLHAQFFPELDPSADSPPHAHGCQCRECEPDPDYQQGVSDRYYFHSEHSDPHTTDADDEQTDAASQQSQRDDDAELVSDDNAGPGSDCQTTDRDGDYDSRSDAYEGDYDDDRQREADDDDDDDGSAVYDPGGRSQDEGASDSVSQRSGDEDYGYDDGGQDDTSDSSD